MNGIYNIMAQRPGVFRFVLILFEEYRFQVISSPFELYMYQAVSARTQPQTSVVVRNNAINRFEQRAGWIAGGYFKKKAGFWVYHGNTVIVTPDPYFICHSFSKREYVFVQAPLFGVYFNMVLHDRPAWFKRSYL